MSTTIRTAASMVVATGGLLAAAPPTPPPPPPPSLAPLTESSPPAWRLADDAAQAMAEERWDDAIGLYGQLREVMPDTPQIPYNLGIAHHGKGDYDRAAEQLEEALSLSRDPELASKAAHNLLSSIWEQTDPLVAESETPGGLAPQGEPDAMEQRMATLESAPKRLERALNQFKRRLDTDPADLETRRDGELAQQRIEQLRKVMEQMQQQQSEQQQGEQDQEQQDQEDQQQQQQQQGEQEQQEQQQQQQQQGQQPDDQQQQEQQDQQQEQQQAGAEQQDQQEQQQQSGAQQEQQAGDEQQQQQPAAAEQMSPEQAERLLQQVRDKEQQRRQELARRRLPDQRPVDKDW